MSKILEPNQDLKDDKLQEHPTTLDVVTSLMNTDNIVMKTEIINPYALDTLKMYANCFKQHGQDNASQILEDWIELLLEYMVSNKRKSREEITEILKGYFTLERDKERNFKLTSNLAKLNVNNNEF